MGIIKKMQDFMEHKKLKGLTDYEIIEKIPEIVEREPEKVAKVLEYVEEQQKVTEVLTDIAQNLSPNTVQKIVENLPEKEKVEAFKESVAVRDKLTQTSDKEELKKILKNKSINAYDELYRRISKGINDYELINFINSFKENKNIGYDGEKISRIISKQMALYIRKYKSPLKGHVQILLGVLKTDEEKRNIPNIVMEEIPKIVLDLEKNKNELEKKLDLLNEKTKKKEEKFANTKKGKKDAQKLTKETETLSKELSKIPCYITNLQEYKKENLEKDVEQIIEFNEKRAEERGI